MSKLRVVGPDNVDDFFGDSTPNSSAPPPGGTQPPCFEPPAPHDPGSKISIDVAIDHLPTLNSLCWEAIKKENRPPVMFRYGSKIVRTIRDASGGVFLQTVTPEVMRNELSNWAHFHKNETKLAKPPLDLMTDVLMSRDLPLPVLRGVVGAPVFATDGSLNLTPGYDEKSGLLYAPRPDFIALPVPDKITEQHVAAANKLLCEEVLVDFPFASTADRDNILALFILPFAREFIPGPTPNHLIESSMNGSGKGKLGNAVLRPFTGRALGVVPDPHDERELAKEITTQLMEGKQVVMFDNFTTLNSASLAALWTSEIWDKRVLGSQQAANVEIRTVWVTTGKNVQMSTEMARRCLRSRITPSTDRPEERQGFRHEDLEAWVMANRSQLVLAAHVIIRWWVQKGMPASTHKRTLGSFETWARVIGGILEQAGYTEFLANHREFQSKSDSERNARSAFCATWFEWVEMNPQDRFYSATGDLMPLTEGIDGLLIKGATPRALQTSLGIYLGTNVDVQVEHIEEIHEGQFRSRMFRIGRGTQKKGKQMWFIEKVGESVLQGPDM